MIIVHAIDQFKGLLGPAQLLEHDLRPKSPSAACDLCSYARGHFLGFSHRISRLLGYTGGESLEQIVLDPRVHALPVQSYTPRNLVAKTSFSSGDRELWLLLPEALEEAPGENHRSAPELPPAPLGIVDGGDRCFFQ